MSEPAISEDVSFLEKMIEKLDWEHFQAINDGNIYCWSDRTNLVRFCYRIGLHMRRPMEAIMAKGDFIRFRPAPDYAAHHLERLDPENVDKCLYDTCLYNVATDSYTQTNAKRWQPSQQTIPQQQAAWNQLALQQQHQAALYQQHQAALNQQAALYQQNKYPSGFGQGMLGSAGGFSTVYPNTSLTNCTVANSSLGGITTPGGFNTTLTGGVGQAPSAFKTFFRNVFGTTNIIP